MNTQEINPGSNGKDRRELRAASQVGAGSTCRSDYLCSSGDRSRWTAARTRGGLTPAVSVRRSVHRDHVICLDCGYRGKTLTRHIATRHGLSADQYRQRWGLRSNQLLTAPAYSERRLTLAKELGLGRKPVAKAASPPTSAASTSQGIVGTSKMRRTGRSRPASTSKGAASETAVLLPPTRASPFVGRRFRRLVVDCR